MNALLNQYSVSDAEFATIMADIFAVCSKNIHFPAYFGEALSVTEVITIFETEFNFRDQTQKDSIEIIYSKI